MNDDQMVVQETIFIVLCPVYNAEVTEDPHSEIVIISEPISTQRVAEMAAERFGDMVKAVVDTNRRLLALGGELHSDEEAALLELGSTQADLWGINIYPDQQRSEWIEFDSLINIRPRLGNRSRGVEDAGTRQLICEIVDSLIR
ncbi:MAG: DUF5674 family protein [Acidobacteriota bacterium]